MSSGRARLQKKTFLAIYELEKRGIEPLDEIINIMREALKSYHEQKGSRDDSGQGYLAIAAKMAEKLASYKYPSLSAVAVKDMSELDHKNEKPLTTAEAIEIIKADPFAPPEVKRINENDLLPIGEANAPKR